MVLKKNWIWISLFCMLMAVCAVSGWAEDTAKININTASAAELTQLNGVGQEKAAGIVSYREDIAPFSKIEDFMKVRGIGEKIFEKNKDRITVGAPGKSTTTESKKKG